MVLASAGITLSSVAAGCLSDPNSNDEERDSDEERRQEAACSHMPAGATQLQHETAILRHEYVPLIAGGKFRHEESDEDITPFALVATSEDIETRLQLDTLDTDDEDHAEIREFIEGTAFETESLLVWQTSTLSGGYQVEIVGVDQPEDKVIHAYTCMYHNGGGNGNVETPYNILIRVEVPQQPEQAKLTYRRGFSSGERHETTTYENP